MSVVQSQSLSYAAPAQRTPWYRRINWRLVVFVVVISAPFAGIIGMSVWNSSHGPMSADGTVDLKQLGSFVFDEETGTEASIPQASRDLDGKVVRLRGYPVSDSASATGKRFQFVYDVNKCCFSGKPQVQERVNAHSATEIPIPSSFTFCELKGTLHVRLRRSDGLTGPVVSVFDLDVESLQPVQ